MTYRQSPTFRLANPALPLSHRILWRSSQPITLSFQSIRALTMKPSVTPVQMLPDYLKFTSSMQRYRCIAVRKTHALFKAFRQYMFIAFQRTPHYC